MDFVVVILSGGIGVRSVAPDRPKGLLPICGMPILIHQLNLVERSGFRDVIIVTEPDSKGAIETLLANTFESRIHVSVEEVDMHCETGEILLELRSKIHTDFIVISGDLMTDFNLAEIADLHRTQDATVTVLLKDTRDGNVAKPSEPLPCVGISEDSRLVVYSTESDRQIRVPVSLLERFPSLLMSTTCTAPHVYAMSHWVLGFLAERNKDRNMVAIEDQLIPALVDAQFGSEAEELGARIEEHKWRPVDPTWIAAIPPRDKLRVLALRTPCYCERATSAAVYLAIQKHVICNYPAFCGKPLPPVPQEWRSQVRDSWIGEELRIKEVATPQERTSIKQSVIGRCCNIGKRCKIIGCVLMDHVTVDDGCTLTRTVICDNNFVNANTAMTDEHMDTAFRLAEGSGQS